MLNISSQEFKQNSSEQSEDIIPGTTYTRKLKKINKRCHKIYGGNKKKKCQNYNKGTCLKGRQCEFTHSFVPDIAKKFCLSFLRGQCDEGSDCFYSHNTKGYPCREYYFTKKCHYGANCPYSHGEIDSDAEDDFLKENQEYLLKLQLSGGNGLQEKFLPYLNNLSKTGTKQSSIQNEDPVSQLPEYFWLPLKKTSLIIQNVEEKSQSLKKRGRKRKQEIEKKPQPPKTKGTFSIRFITKNRNQIPEKLQDELIDRYSNIYNTQKINKAWLGNFDQSHPEAKSSKDKVNINVDQYIA